MSSTALALCGSPRAAGNTRHYIEAAVEELRARGVDAGLVSLHNKTIKSCRACYRCWKSDSGVCQEAGDDFREIYDRMVEADALIVGSPVHYSAVHPDLWSVLVRAGFPGMAGHPNSAPRPFARKIGGPITVARRAGHNAALSQLLLWFFINGFIVPGSIYWTVGVARSPGDAAGDAEGIATVRAFARNVAWLLERTDCGASAARV
jgi:multimeric flavodoxin WrbA